MSDSSQTDSLQISVRLAVADLSGCCIARGAHWRSSCERCAGVLLSTVVPSSNRLFDRLSAAARERLRPHTELVHLSRGRVLHDIGEPPRHTFLLLDGMVSLMPFTDDGTTFEVATIGNDGFVGLSLVLAGSPSPYQAVVQLPGAAY